MWNNRKWRVTKEIIKTIWIDEALKRNMKTIIVLDIIIASAAPNLPLSSKDMRDDVTSVKMETGCRKLFQHGCNVLRDYRSEFNDPFTSDSVGEEEVIRFKMILLTLVALNRARCTASYYKIVTSHAAPCCSVNIEQAFPSESCPCA